MPDLPEWDGIVENRRSRRNQRRRLAVFERTVFPYAPHICLRPLGLRASDYFKGLKDLSRRFLPSVLCLSLRSKLIYFLSFHTWANMSYS